MPSTPRPRRQRPSEKKEELKAPAKHTHGRRSSNSSRNELLNFRGTSILRAALYLVAAAAGSYVSQLSLSPVYGEIPSSLYHGYIVAVLFFLVWLSKGAATAAAIKKLPPSPIRIVIPLLVLYAPWGLNFAFRFSSALGPVYGPIVTEGLTYYPVLFLAVYSAARLTEFNNNGNNNLPLLFDAVPAGLTYAVFSIARSTIPDLLRNRIGSSWALTRCGLTHILGGIYALLSPNPSSSSSSSSLLLLLTALPALYHSAFVNPMCSWTPALNQTLASSNFSIVARQESITGYISVLENLESGYRVMRCDHSLLGGEWQRPPAGFEHMDHANFKEPIYAIFVIMEAVRLVDPPPKNPNPRALAIGLGIGTSAWAMINHGIETDIVELDPAVYRYAVEYFALPRNHTAYVEDAVGFVKRETSRGNEGKKKKYDYILHDVFTGGAVPASLFTLQVFTGLRDMLNDDGVIAVNWAGDLKLKAARSVIETIRHVFGNCRVFREDKLEDETKTVDFTNMVVFCTKSRARSYTFRQPAEQDYLGSFSRRRYMYPQHEIDLERYWGESKSKSKSKSGDDDDGSGSSSSSNDWTVLEESNIHELDAWQKGSAVGHWVVIRTVVPDRVWENY